MEYTQRTRTFSKRNTLLILQIDILGHAAMENAYYICHNAVDCLEKRGFPWPGGSGKKGGKKGKKGRKKKK